MKYRIVKNDSGEHELPQFTAAHPQWTLEAIVLPLDIVQQLEHIECFVQNSQILFDQWEFHRFMRSSRGVAVNSLDRLALERRLPQMLWHND